MRTRNLGLVIFAVVGSMAVADVGGQKETSGAYRVTATIKPVVFPLPGKAGRVVMGAGSTVTVDGRRPNGPWKVTVEDGEVALRLAADSAAGGSSLEGGTDPIAVAPGQTAWRWRRAATGLERAGLVDAVSASQLEILKVLDAGPAVRFTMSVPPSAGSSGTPDPGVEFRPLVLGTATVSLADARAVESRENLTSHRERLMISTRGKGLAGPGVFVDFAGGRGDRARNLVVSGAVGTVKFFVKPSWRVTLAPRTVLELDATEADALRRAPPRMKLLRGAMMLEERPGATPATTGPVKFDGLAVDGHASAVFGRKQIVFAAPRTAGERDAAATLSAALRDLDPVEPPAPGPRPLAGAATGHPDDAGRCVPGAAVTLMGELPATPKALKTMLPVEAQLTGQESSLDVSMMARMPQGREGLNSRALEAVERSADGTELPVALVVPRELPADPGPDPADYTVLVHPGHRARNARPVSDVLAEQEKAWRGLDRKAAGNELAPTRSPYPLGFVIGGGLLALFFMVRGERLVELSQELVLGRVTRRCERCGQALDQRHVAGIGSLEEQGPLFALLGFDDITDAHRQNRTREALLAWARQLQPQPGKDRLQVRSEWCPGCAEGVLVCEMVGPRGVRDESACSFVHEETHSMVKAVSRREAAREDGVRV